MLHALLNLSEMSVLCPLHGHCTNLSCVYFHFVKKCLCIKCCLVVYWISAGLATFPQPGV